MTTTQQAPVEWARRILETVNKFNPDVVADLEPYPSLAKGIIAMDAELTALRQPQAARLTEEECDRLTDFGQALADNASGTWSPDEVRWMLSLLRRLTAAPAQQVTRAEVWKLVARASCASLHRLLNSAITQQECIDAISKETTEALMSLPALRGLVKEGGDDFQ